LQKGQFQINKPVRLILISSDSSVLVKKYNLWELPYSETLNDFSIHEAVKKTFVDIL
jgi:hypothetical protein